MKRFELNDALRKCLLKEAVQAAKGSYSPYSRFPVGAALLSADGVLFTGCNVENASFGLTLCAERIAVLKAVSEGRRKFVALAVVGGKGRAIRPCGACLQVLAEFCGPDFPVILSSLGKSAKAETVAFKELLPQVFSGLS